jgi:hypothetical protein
LSLDSSFASLDVFSGPGDPEACRFNGADSGLQGFTAVFDVVAEPHWLKCLILRFSVFIASKLDDKTEQASNTESKQSSAQQSTQNMAPSKPMGSSAGHSVPSEPNQQIAIGTAGLPPSLSVASERGWLPPALLPPKGDGSGKSKQSRKSVKQRSSQAGMAKEEMVKCVEQPQSSNDSDSWDIPAGHKDNSCVAHSSGSSEAGDDRDVSSATPPHHVGHHDEDAGQAIGAWPDTMQGCWSLPSGIGMSRSPLKDGDVFSRHTMPG